jgi:hypothetical protein
MADSIQHTDKQIRADLDHIRSEMAKHTKIDPSERDKHFKSMKNKMKVVKNLLTNYDMFLSMESNKVAEQYRKSYEDLCREHKDLEVQLNNVKDQALQDNFETDIRSKREKPLEQMNKQEIMDYGDRMQKRMDEKVDDALRLLVDAKQIQDEVGKELIRIEEVLIKTQDAAKDTQSMLKRSKQLINYFYRQLQTDKIIWCFLILLVLLILAIIIMSFAGVKSSSFNSKVLPNQK